MVNKAIGAAVAATVGLGAAQAAAEDNSVMVLGEVTVSEAASGPLATSGVFSSVDIVGADRVEKQNVRSAWQLYDQVPGVQLTDFGQGAWSGKLSFRGFNGEGEINAVKLLLDGIPSNSNDGNMPYLDMIFPLEIESIEVVRGTNDPRYGLHNIAGNTNINTKQGGNESEARLSYGSFNTRQVQAAQGVEIGEWSQNYFVGWQDTDGWRDHAGSEKRTVSGKWFHTSADGDRRVGLIARHYKNQAEESGYLTLAQAADDPRQSRDHNSTDGGLREMNQVSGHLDMTLTDRLSLSTKAYVNTYGDDRWVRYSALVSQQERVTDEKHSGALGTLTWRPAEVPLIHALALEGGASIEHQNNESLRYTTRNRTRISQTRNQHFDLDDLGGYVQAVVQPVQALKLIPAWRVDRLDGEYSNRLNGIDYSINDYGTINQPKFSAILSPTDAYSLYANWGRTFQVGTGTGAYKVGQADDLQPSINEGWEVGVKVKPLAWLDGRVALWEQVADNEARRKLNDPSNASENIGKTRRNGVDVELSLRPVDQIRLWGGYSWQDSEILQADTSSPASQGKEIDHVPHHVFSAGIDYMPTAEWKFSLTGHGQSDYYLERTNSTGTYGDYLLFDLGANYQVNERFSVDLQVRNLTNASYEYVWWDSDNSQALVAPGDGIGLFAGVSVKM